MRRLTRAVTEIESFKASLLNARKGWSTPSELMVIGLLNTALATLAQVQVLAPMSVANIDPKVDRVAEMIGQINREVDDEKECNDNFDKR